MLSLSQELQCLREQKDALLTAGAQSSAEEKEKLLSAVTSLTAERDQLKMDLQENVEMVSDHVITCQSTYYNTVCFVYECQNNFFHF